jgi:transposase InsO family protein
MITKELRRKYDWLFLTERRLPGYFYAKPPPRKSAEERTRLVADLCNLSPSAKKRLNWILFYTKTQSASYTARHFGISRKILYKWLRRWNPANVRSLEERSRTPRQCRQKEYTAQQYQRVTALRRTYLRYGKTKLLVIYQSMYEDKEISLWKVQKIIERSGIYYNAKKQWRINKKKKHSVAKRRITDLKRAHHKGFLLCADTIVIYWNSVKRYIHTGIDRFSKVAFARMYTTNSSATSADFLRRLHYLLDGKIENIQTDNGSEFAKYFESLCTELRIDHYFSRVRTPKDNAVNERFNRTLQEEFLQLGNMTADTVQFNQRLTEWLIEYNFHRPHQALGMMPPINFSFKYHKVLPMYPSNT